MTTIGLISDTHSFLDSRIEKFFENIDQIWHAGDIGSVDVSDRLCKMSELIAVYGNIDNSHIRIQFPEYQYSEVDGVGILMMHIGGYPGRYSVLAKELISKYKPKIFISGHSHILKVMNDKKNGLLHINPGAAGNNGFHNVKTAIRFKVDKGNILDLEVWEAQR